MRRCQSAQITVARTHDSRRARGGWLVGGLLACSVIARAAEPASTLPAGQKVDFAKEIQPIFQDRCVACHGPEKQKGGLRLDLRSAAFKGGDEYGPAILPGKSAQSPLIRLVSGRVMGAIMPAKGARLSAEQIARLRDWIDQGADWPEGLGPRVADRMDWWSLHPLQRPNVPALGAGERWARNPIDNFILARLRERGLSPSPEADRRTLIRRLSFDLIGLPPTPEEVDRFVKDRDPDAYERLVDSLLASPRYGERWARHWLDVARYGDTHGYDKDKPRPHAWPYRDYVVRALNQDKPYGRFVQEQVAGDELFPDTVDGVEALGFIAAGPWDFIGHAEVPESKTDGKIARLLDRDDMVSNTMNAFCSLTIQCARCHDHKFDAVTQEDYYRLHAVFAAVDRADKEYDTDPAVGRRRSELQSRRHALTTKRQELEARQIAAGGKELEDLDKRLKEARAAKTGDHPEYGWHSAIEATPDHEKWVQVDLGAPLEIQALSFVGCHDDFNHIGDGFGFPPRFRIEVSDDPTFQSGVSVVADHTLNDFPNPGVKPQRVDLGGKRARFARMTATKLAPRQNDYIFALAELSVFDTRGTNMALKASVTSLDSIEAPPRWRRENLVDGYYPESESQTAAAEVARLEQARRELIERTTDQTTRSELEFTSAELARLKTEIDKLPPAKLVYAGTVYYGEGAFSGTGPAGGKPRPIFVLARGDVRNPRQEVGPGTVRFIKDERPTFEVPNDASEAARRAALARWLTDKRNPLTWRSIVNRVWEYHFGRGIVDSPNDFGHMGQLPSHPELLDWLAVEFRDSGQSLKELHRLIVTSATYRQASAIGATSQKAGSRGWAVDADNRLLWHMNRRKLEAEELRDSLLSVAGKLDLTMGGPGFEDFVVEKPEHSPHYEYRLHDPEDPKSHRRSIYRFIVRSQPEPFMTALDCADPSMSVERRNETVNPLQALALLNDKLVIAMSQHFAARVGNQVQGPVRQVTLAYRLALGRGPSPDERKAMEGYVRQYGLANACRLIFNLNEFAFVD